MAAPPRHKFELNAQAFVPYDDGKFYAAKARAWASAGVLLPAGCSRIETAQTTLEPHRAESTGLAGARHGPGACWAARTPPGLSSLFAPLSAQRGPWRCVPPPPPAPRVHALLGGQPVAALTQAALTRRPRRWASASAATIRSSPARRSGTTTSTTRCACARARPCLRSLLRGADLTPIPPPGLEQEVRRVGARVRDALPEPDWLPCAQGQGSGRAQDHRRCCHSRCRRQHWARRVTPAGALPLLLARSSRAYFRAPRAAQAHGSSCRAASHYTCLQSPQCRARHALLGRSPVLPRPPRVLSRRRAPARASRPATPARARADLLPPSRRCRSPSPRC